MVSRITVGVLVLFLLTTGVAFAWPDTPPDKATISGPGLAGEVTITDKESLAAQRLGALEDFDQGVIPPPSVGAGYIVTRYFYNGSFNFAQLHYYPSTAGLRGYIYFDDGPDLRGDHTPYHQKWLYATAQGDAAMQRLLTQLGATRQGSTNAESTSQLPFTAQVNR